MKINTFNDQLNYNDDKIVTQIILETSFSKEIRILMKQGQKMKEHKAPYPIVVHILEGSVDFGVNGEISILKKGDIISLESSIPHDLTATKDCIVRLTLSKLDDANRVVQAAQKA